MVVKLFTNVTHLLSFWQSEMRLHLCNLMLAVIPQSMTDPLDAISGPQPTSLTRLGSRMPCRSNPEVMEVNWKSVLHGILDHVKTSGVNHGPPS